jgi:hypothetical protein
MQWPQQKHCANCVIAQQYPSAIFIIWHVFENVRGKWVPVTTAWRVLRLRMEERPPDMEGSCEYIEQAVADSRQGVVFQLGGWAKCYQLLTLKT